jgi:hypothetical protein
MTDRNPDLLPVLSTMRNAFVIPWRKRAVMARALLPISLFWMVLDGVSKSFVGDSQNLVSLAGLCVAGILFYVVITLFSVTCH